MVEELAGVEGKHRVVSVYEDAGSIELELL